MRKRYIEIITAASITIFAFIISAFALILYAGKESDNKIPYDNLYFVDGSLVSGGILINTLEYFDECNMQIVVKTKLSDMITYIWDGINKIDNYNINTKPTERNYINKDALFRVKVNSSHNKIDYVIFMQE